MIKSRFITNKYSDCSFHNYILLFAFFMVINLKSKAQCTLKNSSSSISTYVNSTGSSEIDNIVRYEKIKLEQFFNVKVDLKIISGFNAYAKPYSKSTDCNGTIELGKDLLNYEFKKKGPTSGLSIGKHMIMAIVAHEFAHIFQYSHPELKFNNSVIQEVHADLIAGWYLTKYLVDNIPESEKYLTSSNWDNIHDIYTDLTISFGWLGDRAYWSQEHHGNYNTRSMAFHEGWSVYKQQGIKDFSYYLKWSVQTAEELVRKWDAD